MNNKRILIERVKKLLNEAPPMSFGPEVGGARPSKDLQSKIEGGKLPLSQFGLTQAQVDFFTSQAFKESVLNLERIMDRSSGVIPRLTRGNQNLKRDAQTAFRELYSLVNELLGELIQLQGRNQEELEEIATESVEKAMGIDRKFFEQKQIDISKFVPPVDYSSVSSFAKFGLASKYYTDSYTRISQQYPYDGSLREKTQFFNTSSNFDKWIYDNKYPRFTGFVTISPTGWGNRVGSLV